VTAVSPFVTLEQEQFAGLLERLPIGVIMFDTRRKRVGFVNNAPGGSCIRRRGAGAASFRSRGRTSRSMSTPSGSSIPASRRMCASSSTPIVCMS
jgi:hypothetical protein